VKGLHCMSCVARLERALRQIEGVRRSAVDLRRETVDLAYESQAIDKPSIRSVIEETGFEVVAWAPR